MATFLIYDKDTHSFDTGLNEGRDEVSLRGCDGARHVEKLLVTEFEFDPDGRVKRSLTFEGRFLELGPCNGLCGHEGSFTWSPEAPRESLA
jgi:hypothetical protein